MDKKCVSFEQITGYEQLSVCLEIIQKSFWTVAVDFGITRENCPSHTAFITLGKLKSQFDENRLMFIMRYDEKPVGYFSLCKSGESNTVFELNNLSVLPEYRHMGFGGMMIDKAKKTVKNLGGEKINIGIIEENERLKNWYKKKGFVHMGTKKFPHLPFTTGFMTNDIAAEGKTVTAREHYDMLIDENSDPVYDPEPLKEHMNKWDGQSFIDELRLTKNENVLEIGIGTGRIAVRTAPMCKKLTGIDISSKTAERAEENLKEFSNTAVILGDFMTYEFNEKFDVIYSSLTFMHIEDKQSAINKIAVLLAPGGRFVLSVDKNQSEFIDMGERKIKIYPDNPADILKYASNAGLNAEKHFETDFAHIFVFSN